MREDIEQLSERGMGFGGRLLPSYVEELFDRGLKYCPQCKYVLSITAFGPDNSSKYGVYSYCRECKRQYGRENRTRNGELKQGRDKRKLEVLELFGKKCARCGYSEFIGSLVFHHVDPREKDYTISSLIGARKLPTNSDEVIEELDKCILLCSNCHRGIHSGEWIPKYRKRANVGWESEYSNKLLGEYPGEDEGD